MAGLVGLVAAIHILFVGVYREDVDVACAGMTAKEPAAKRRRPSGKTNLENRVISMGAFRGACAGTTVKKPAAKQRRPSWQNEPRKSNDFNGGLPRPSPAATRRSDRSTLARSAVARLPALQPHVGHFPVFLPVSIVLRPVFPPVSPCSCAGGFSLGRARRCIVTGVALSPVNRLYFVLARSGPPETRMPRSRPNKTKLENRMIPVEPRRGRPVANFGRTSQLG
jgi:hypothetical protein